MPTEPPVPSGAVEGCAGVAIGAVLHGAAADPRAAWLIDDFSGTRTDVVWPPGYRARFTPNLEVLDASEVVVLKAGDPVAGACVVKTFMLTLQNPGSASITADVVVNAAAEISTAVPPGAADSMTIAIEP